MFNFIPSTQAAHTTVESDVHTIHISLIPKKTQTYINSTY